MSRPARYFDISHLSGDRQPVSLATILRENGGAQGMDPDELARLRACKVGGRVNLGIGGGHVTFVRVPAPRKKTSHRRRR